LMKKQIALVAFDDDHPLPPEVEHAVVTFYAPGTACSGTHVFLPTRQQTIKPFIAEQKTQ
jgi:hypothetical protein